MATARNMAYIGQKDLIKNFAEGGMLDLNNPVFGGQLMQVSTLSLNIQRLTKIALRCFIGRYHWKTT